MTDEKLDEQAVVQQESDPGQLIVTTFYRSVTPHELFRHWTQPGLITQWWSPTAEINAQQNGHYTLSWPSMSWTLRGDYTTCDPDTHLAFTWRWDHEPNIPTRYVDIRFEPIGDIGTQLTITHSTYTATPQDQEERQSHLEGWTYFLTRLHSVLS